jgi:hypothetical protein
MTQFTNKKNRIYFEGKLIAYYSTEKRAADIANALNKGKNKKKTSLLPPLKLCRGWDFAGVCLYHNHRCIMYLESAEEAELFSLCLEARTHAARYNLLALRKA